MSATISRSGVASPLGSAILLVFLIAGQARGDEVIAGSPLNISIDDYQNATVLRYELDAGQPAPTWDKQYYSVYSPFLVMTPSAGESAGVAAVWSGYYDLNNLAPVSNTISADGFTITSLDTVDSGNVSIQQVVTYINGSQQYQHTWVVTNNTANPYTNVAFRYGGDTYFADSDYAIGYWDAALGFVYCTDPNASGLMGMYGGPGTPATNYYEDGYGNVWDALENPSAPLPNTFVSSYIDNAMGLEWVEGTLAAYGSFTVTVIEEWTAPGLVQVVPPPSQNITVGTPVTLTFTVQNLESTPLPTDTFNLSVTPSSGLGASVAQTVTIPANSSAPVTVTVTATTIVNPMSVTLSATSQTTSANYNLGVAALTSTGLVVVQPPVSQSIAVGTPVTVPFTVQNLESTGDTFTLSVAASSGLGASVAQSVTLAANASATVNVTVTATSIVNPMSVTLTATSLTTSAITNQGLAALTPTDQVVVQPPASQNIAVGTPLTLAFTVQNLESASDTFSLGVVGSSGLHATVAPSVTIAANATTTVDVTVTATAIAAPMTVTLTASSLSNATIADQAVAELTPVVALGSVVVTPPDGTQIYTQGGTLQVNFMVQNDETFPATDTFTISTVTSANIFAGTIAPVQIAAGQSTTVSVLVTVPLLGSSAAPTLADITASSTLALVATSATTPSIAGQATAALAMSPVTVIAPQVALVPTSLSLNIPFFVATDPNTTAVITFYVSTPYGVTAATPYSVTLPPSSGQTVQVPVTVTSLAAGAYNAVTLTASSASPTAQASTILVQAQPVALPSIPLSPLGQTVYNSISPSTPEGVANLLAVMAPQNSTTAQAYSWDMVQQNYVLLPSQPTGGLQPSSGVFLATRLQLGLDFSGTPTALPFYLTLQPGWNYVGIPLLIDGSGIVDATSSFPSDFTLFDGNNAQIGDDATIADDLGTVGSGDITTAYPFFYDGSGYIQQPTLSTTLGYWIKNNTSQPLTLVRNQDVSDSPPSRVKPATTQQSSSANAGTLTDRGSPPPPPSSGANGDSSGGSGCGLGAGAAAFALLGLALARRRLRP